MKRLIEIRAHFQDMGGVTISYDGKVVAEYLNTMEAFVTLAGMLDGGPQLVKLTMPQVSESFEHNFDAGRRVVAQAAPRSSSKEKLELVEIGGPDTDTMCPSRHKGAVIRILRWCKSKELVTHWFQCAQGSGSVHCKLGHGSEYWPSNIEEAKRLVGIPSRP